MRVADYLAPRSVPPQRPVRRDAVVAAVSTPTPHLRRIVLEGRALMDIRSERFDDHVKLEVPGTDARRSYTIRHVDGLCCANASAGFTE